MGLILNFFSKSVSNTLSIMRIENPSKLCAIYNFWMPGTFHEYTTKASILTWYSFHENITGGHLAISVNEIIFKM